MFLIFIFKLIGNTVNRNIISIFFIVLRVKNGEKYN